MPDPANLPLRDRLIVGGLCAFAALRIFLFSSAFPFFNNVDEQFHFDLISHYAQGQFPSVNTSFTQESARAIALDSSPEFFGRPQDQSTGQFPPPLWTLPRDIQTEAIRQDIAFLTVAINRIANDPPLYYVLAGGWMDAGKLLGFSGASLLYWTRWLDIPLYVVLILLAHRLARAIFPDSRFIGLGVPVLLAVFPQDLFYSLNSDVLSAPLGALTLYLLLRLLRSGSPGIGLAVGAGLAAAAGFLTKYVNAPLVALAGFVAMLMVQRIVQTRQPARNLWRPILLLTATLLPIALWLMRNQIVLGELTGQLDKSRTLLWSPKPIDQWLDHPIFSLGGVVYFWPRLMRTFWRGEIAWHGVEMARQFADGLYVIASTLFPLCLLIALPRKAPANQRGGLLLCFSTFILYVATIVYLSISFDFGGSVYPSREHPFFVSGRLIIAALAPFTILLIAGLDQLACWVRWTCLRWILLGIIAGICLWSEIAITTSVFASQYNWFHLP